jgi:hypothetical protein
MRLIFAALKPADVRKRGSLPAVLMYEWLLISMELRDQAVEGRKRHSTLFEKESSQDSLSQTFSEDEDDESLLSIEDGILKSSTPSLLDIDIPETINERASEPH